MLYPTIDTVESRYGAPMGRNTFPNLHTEGDLLLFRVPLDAGGYDPGGAHWGLPNDLWCATDAWHFRTFTRAGSFLEAAGKITALYPFAKDFKPLGLSDFFAGYASAALWTESFEEPDQSPKFYRDAGYGVSDLTDSARERMLADASSFLASAADLIARITEKRGQFDYERAGQVFWYVRQGHGVGWHDDPEQWAGHAEHLRQLTEKYRTQQYLYLTDDHKVDLE